RDIREGHSHMQDADAMLNRMVLAAGRIDTLLDQLRKQVADSQAAIQATREAQEARFQQTLARLFEQQQARMAATLRPQIAWAWKMLIATTAGIALLLAAGAALLTHSYQRVQAAEVRATAAEIDAETREALRNVRISSCGGRPCILLDRDQSTWSSARGEFVLLDDRPAPGPEPVAGVDRHMGGEVRRSRPAVAQPVFWIPAEMPLTVEARARSRFSSSRPPSRQRCSRSTCSRLSGST